MSLLIGCYQHRHPVIFKPLRVAPEDALVVNRLSQPYPALKTRRGGTQGNGSDRQPGAALGAACIDDATAVLGAHTGTKAMRTLALQVAWLKCSFHDACFPVCNTRACRARKGRKGYCLTDTNVNSKQAQRLSGGVWITCVDRYRLPRSAAMVGTTKTGG